MTEPTASPAEPAPDSKPSTPTRDKIAAAKLPERTVDICLRGDLQAQFEDLERQLAAALAAEAANGKRLNSGAGPKRIAEQMEALQEQMREDTIVFRLRALSRRAWSELLKQHPPRKDEEADTYLGYNPDAFLPAAIRACTYEPGDLDDDLWAELLDERLTEQQFISLQNAVMALNVRKVDVPNSRAASRILRPSEPE